MFVSPRQACDKLPTNLECIRCPVIAKPDSCLQLLKKNKTESFDWNISKILQSKKYIYAE